MTPATAEPNVVVGRGKLTLSYGVLGLVLVVDQLLLPMFHIGRLPYKVSYFVVALWALHAMAVPARDRADAVRRADFARFAAAFAGIVGCALLGEFMLDALQPATSHALTGRIVTIYLLMVLSFGLGLNAGDFNLKALVWVLFAALFLNLVFALLRNAVPGWLVDFYYSELDVEALSQFGVKAVEDILGFARPRGIFPNPNAAMLMVNVIVIFIHVAVKHGLLRIRSGIVAFGIIVLPILLAAVLASRGEFIASVVLAVVNYRVMFPRLAPSARRSAKLVLASAFVGTVLTLVSLDPDGYLVQNFNRIASILDAVEASETVGEKSESIARPLLTFEQAYGRFKESPVFGSGYGAGSRPPFLIETQYFHNDWFMLVVTSGLIGVGLMLWILWNYCVPLAWVTLLPFVLAGLTNTFMLNIPATMFYFFMVGVLREKLRPPVPIPNLEHR